jgi:hypothetical protein
MAVFLAPDESTVRNLGMVSSPLFGSSYEGMVPPCDNWGNVRVPRLELLPGAQNSNSSGWHRVPATIQIEQLSSLLGVPVVGLHARQSDMSVDFSLETSYMSLDCAAWEEFPESHPVLAEFKRHWQSRDPLRNKPGDVRFWRNDEVNTTFFLDGDMPSVTQANASTAANNHRSRRLFFASARRDNSSAEYILSATKCVVTEIHAEVGVHCPTGLRDCKATRMRRSLVDRRPRSNTPLDSHRMLMSIIQLMPKLQSDNGESSSTTELFLHDTARYLERMDGAKHINMAEVPPSLFASRLTLVLNTWYQILLTPSDALMGNAPTDVAAYGFDFGQLPANGSVPQSVVDKSCRHMCTRSTTAVVTNTKLVFTYHPVWLALLFACSGMLLLVGLAGLIVGWSAHMPDVLGYVASMTYHNTYLPLPERGGVLDGMRRARILRDLPISVGDVAGDNADVGRVAFTSRPDARRLEMGRKYV